MMQLPDKPLSNRMTALIEQLPRTLEKVRIPVLAALAIGLYTTENLLPFPVPWLRVGISNIAILLAIYSLDKKSAATVFFLKIVLGSLLSGRFLTPFFLFALAGGGLSLLVMIIAKHLFSRLLSPIGVSILGSVTHNIGQLLVAYLLFINSKAIFSLLPFLILLGIITGAIVGVLASIILERLI